MSKYEKVNSMVERPNVTIVIPTFNRADMLHRAIESAISQSTRCEVIVVDHGSTDDTPDLVSKYKERITYIRRDIDNGPIFAWIDGVINSKTEYVHITFDDDWIGDSFVEKCLSLLGDECAYVFTGVVLHRSDTDKIKLPYENIFDTGLHDSHELEQFLLRNKLTVSPGCALMRRADILKALRFDTLPRHGKRYHGVGADLLMYLLPLLEYDKFGFINEPLSHFLLHPGSITSNATSEIGKKKDITDAYDEIRQYYIMIKRYYDPVKLNKHLKKYRRSKWRDLLTFR